MSKYEEIKQRADRYQKNPIYNSAHNANQDFEDRWYLAKQVPLLLKALELACTNPYTDSAIITLATPDYWLEQAAKNE